MTLSPCIRLCVVDPLSGLCAGCGRTLAEIGAWMRLTDGERRSVMDLLPARLASMQAPAKPGEAPA